MDQLLQIVHEDDGLLVVNKPAGLVCHPTRTDERSSLIGRVRLHLGGTRAHFVNRLDRETSGVVILAKNRAVARQLGKIWEARSVSKAYLAIVHGHMHESAGVIDAPLGRDKCSRVAIKDCVRSDGVAAVTEFEVETRFARAEGDFSLLRVRPRTGRKHQIRIHLAHAGHPIAGDKIYGGHEDVYLAFVEDRLTDEQRARLIFQNHALHAFSTAFDWRGSRKEFSCEPEPCFKSFLPRA